MTDPVQSGMTTTLLDDIAALAARRARERRDAGWSNRLADRLTGFIGSMRFVALHLVLYGGWIATNLGLVPELARFDPSFVILAMEASVEAIFLSTFVLISQNRMMAAAERRADLDLHINLLAEHELTRVATLVERIATRFDIDVADPDYAEVKQDVEPERVLDAIDRQEQASADRT